MKRCLKTWIIKYELDEERREIWEIFETLKVVDKQNRGLNEVKNWYIKDTLVSDLKIQKIIKRGRFMYMLSKMKKSIAIMEVGSWSTVVEKVILKMRKPNISEGFEVRYDEVRNRNGTKTMRETQCLQWENEREWLF